MNYRPLLLGAALGGLAGFAAWSARDLGPGPASPPAAPILAPTLPGHVVICTQPNCSPCDRLKAELKKVSGVEIRWVDVSAKAARKKYPVRSTPTLIRFGPDGKEVAPRATGYLTAAEFMAWAGAAPPASTPLAEDPESGALPTPR